MRCNSFWQKFSPPDGFRAEKQNFPPASVLLFRCGPEQVRRRDPQDFHLAPEQERLESGISHSIEVVLCFPEVQEADEEDIRIFSANVRF